MTFPSDGKDLVSGADCTIPGIHSRGFQQPFTPPLTCPTLTIIGRRKVFSAAISRILSETHLDWLYPLTVADSGAAGSSGMRSGSFATVRGRQNGKMPRVLVKHNSRVTTATVLIKMNRGGVGSFDSSAKFIRFRTLATFGLNDESPRLKSTLQPNAIARN